MASLVPRSSSTPESRYVQIFVLAGVLSTERKQVANALYERRVGRTMIKLRGTLVASVFSQALVAADGVDTDNAAVTLMSTGIIGIACLFC